MRNTAEDTSPFWVFNQYPDLNSAGKYRVTAHLEFQLGKGPRQHSSPWVKLSRLKFWVPAYNHRTDANRYHYHSVTKLQASFSSVQLLSHVRLFVTLWTAACQASLSITNFQSLLKLMSIEWVMPSNHLILCRPHLLPFNLSQHQSLFKWVHPLHQVAKVLEFQLQHQPFQWIFRTDFL